MSVSFDSGHSALSPQTHTDGWTEDPIVIYQCHIEHDQRGTGTLCFSPHRQVRHVQQRQPDAVEGETYVPIGGPAEDKDKLGAYAARNLISAS
jgi:hypothetical protein